MYKQDLTKLNCFSKSSMTCFSDGNKKKRQKPHGGSKEHGKEFWSLI